MKKIAITTILLSAFFCQAQEKTAVKTFYADNNNNRVSTKDSAKYIRTIASTKSKNDTYEVVELYLNNVIKLKGNSLTNYFNPKYDGNVTSYYTNGNKASEEKYDEGKLKSGEYYYQNSAVKKSVKFDANRSEKVMTFNDSLGKSFLDQKRSGTFKTVEQNGEVVEGSYAKGDRDGTWKTVNSVKNETYFDEYKSGKYIKGKTVFSDGKEIKYDELESLPKFTGTENNFWYFLKSKLEFVNGQQRPEGDWQVSFSYTIEADGSLTDPKIIKRIGRNYDEEILRTIKLSPKWIPAFKRGVAYKMPQQYSIGQFSRTETREVISGSPRSPY